MKNINKFACLAGAAAVLSVGLVACDDDRDDEITSIAYSRIFAPTNVKVQVRNNTNLYLSWTVVADAVAYQVAYCAAEDSLDESKYTVVKSDIAQSTTSYTVEGMAGETAYYVAIQALAEDASRNSKYVGGSVTTEGENITKTVDEAQITSSSAVIEWDDARGAGVTYIEILKDSEVVDGLTHTVTAEEQEAMAATVTGLSESTTYKARLVLEENGTVTYRGTTSNFKTARDLSSFTGGVVSTADELTAALESASDGDIIGINEGAVITVSSLTINKSIEITSVSTTNPGTLNTRFSITNGAGLSISNVILDGSNTSGDQTFKYDEDGNYGDLVVENCEIANYTKGVFYIGDGSLTDVELGSVTFNKCTIHDIECSGGDLFDSRKHSAFNSFTVTNCTIYNSCASRAIFRMDDASSNVSGYTPVFTIENNIFYNCGNGSVNNKSYTFLYIRYNQKNSPCSISFKNNIIEGFNAKCGFYAADDYYTAPSFSNNFYYNCVNLVNLDDDTAAVTPKYRDENGTVLTDASPFADAANGDFTITNEDVYYSGAGPQAD